MRRSLRRNGHERGGEPAVWCPGNQAKHVFKETRDPVSGDNSGTCLSKGDCDELFKWMR